MTNPQLQATYSENLSWRLARSFGLAGKEIALVLSCFIAVLIGIVVLEQLGVKTTFLTTEQRFTMNAWEWQSDRKAKAVDFLTLRLSDTSRFRVYEVPAPPNSDYQQTVIAEVEFKGLTASFDALDMFFELSEAVIGYRGGSYSDRVRVEGPGLIMATLIPAVILISSILIRLHFLPAACPPARPFLPRTHNWKRILGLSAVAGLGIGIIVPLLVALGDQAGLITMSDQMPSLESMGITRNVLWLGAVMLALMGAAEEAFFRGLLLRGFVQNGVASFGVLVCAFWFTIAHYAYFSLHSGNIVYMLWIAIGGLGLGMLTVRMKTWVPAAVVHGSYNFTVTILAGLAAFRLT